MKLNVKFMYSSCFLMLIIFMSNLKFTTSSLSTTVPTLNKNFNNSHEPTCSNIKDFLIQRGIAEKDLLSSPLKG